MISLALPTSTAIFFVAIRLGVILIFTPIQAIRQLPISLRLILVFALSVLLVNYLSLSVNTTNETDLVAYALVEFANGLILALSFSATFAIFHITGQLIDSQMGLNSLAILNPSDHTYESLSSRLLMMIAVLFFFAFDGHHYLLQGIVQSLIINPPGKFIPFNSFEVLIHQFAWMFTFAWTIASPIIISLVIMELFSAIVTRNMQQVNTYFLALPIKILLGFFLFALLLYSISPLMERIIKYCFQTWHAVMA